MSNESSSPFAELPEALVEEMLNKSKILGDDILTSLSKIGDNRKELRDALSKKDLIRQDSSYINFCHPTSCGVDGAYVPERLLTVDLMAVAALAVEGLTPPSEKRYWPKPHHNVVTFNLPHNDANIVVGRAIMVTMEFAMAAKAPHDVVMIDNSLTTPLIYLNQALSRIQDAPKDLSEELVNRLEECADAYLEILSAPRTDKAFIGVPKYTSRNEISSEIGLTNYEDRSLLSILLHAGEFTKPVALSQKGSQAFHTPANLPNGGKILDELRELRILYYKSHQCMPALRIEMPQSIASNSSRLGVILEAIKLQSGYPSMMEPYPLYMADRMAKHLSFALPAIRQSSTQYIASKWEGDIGEIYMAMHGYRSEL